MENILQYEVKGSGFAADLYNQLVTSKKTKYVAKYGTDRYFMLDDNKKNEDNTYPSDAYKEITSNEAHKVNGYVIDFEAVGMPMTAVLGDATKTNAEVAAMVAQSAEDKHSAPEIDYKLLYEDMQAQAVEAIENARVCTSNYEELKAQYEYFRDEAAKELKCIKAAAQNAVESVLNDTDKLCAALAAKGYEVHTITRPPCKCDKNKSSVAT